MKLDFIGSVGTVTGSKTVLETKLHKYLIDCGLYQGEEYLEKKNLTPLPFPAKQIKAVFLTHSHLDHCGALPMLVRLGFRGPIFATRETKALSAIIMQDSAKIQISKVRSQNRKTQKLSKRVRPLYTQEDVAMTLKLFKIVELESEEIFEDLTFKFFKASHILGATSIHFKAESNSILFSGDLGRFSDPLFGFPDKLPKSDYVIMESTYGDKLHPTDNPETHIIKIVETIIKNKGVLILPSFAMARMQNFIIFFDKFFKKYPALKIPVYVDGPMGDKITAIYEAYLNEFPEEVNALKNANFIRYASQTKALEKKKGPYILIASSGMVNGGKILTHLPRLINDQDNILLLAGYQGAGTLGRLLKEGVKSITIEDKEYSVKAQVMTLDHFSAHGDQSDLLRWLELIEGKPQGIFLNHGEDGPRKALSEVLIEKGYSVYIPAEEDHLFDLDHKL
jgi:metallo-beta-lactamase family protein